MNVLLRAYRAGNLGDDLMVDLVCRRYPHVRFFVYDSPGQQGYRSPVPPNVWTFGPSSAWRAVAVRLGMRDAAEAACARNGGIDLDLTLGGSMFQQRRGWPVAAHRLRTAQRRAAATAFVGCNFGPHSSCAYVRAHRRVFARAAAVTLRDHASCRLFADVASVRYAADIMLNLDAEAIVPHCAPGRVVVSVIDGARRGDLSGAYERAIARLGEALARAGYCPLLMSFCRFEGDEQAVERIAAQTPRGLFETYRYRGNLAEALAVIKGADGVVSTRLHAMILAWRFGIPCYPLVYSEKIRHILNDAPLPLGYGSCDLADIDGFDPAEAVAQIAEERVVDVEQLRTSAQGHFSALDGLLGASGEAAPCKIGRNGGWGCGEAGERALGRDGRGDRP